MNTTMHRSLRRRGSALLAMGLLAALVHCNSEELPIGADATGGATTGEQSCRSAEPPDTSGVCPSEWTSEVGDGFPCNLPAGETCVWDYPGSWAACTCSCVNQGKWTCFGMSGAPTCPTEQPQTGDACPSNSSMECWYFPSTHCACEGGAFSCGPADTEFWCANGDFGTDEIGASGIAPSTPINELSDEAAAAWCDWYTMHFPGGGVSPYEPREGVVFGGATAHCDPGCVMNVPPEYCVQNLRLDGCDIPLVWLEDCVRTIWNPCATVGRGCGAWRQCDKCSRTIVQTPTGEAYSETIPESCVLPIE